MSALQKVKPRHIHTVYTARETPPRIRVEQIQKEGTAEQFMDNICPTLLDIGPMMQEQVYCECRVQLQSSRTDRSQRTSRG